MITLYLQLFLEFFKTGLFAIGGGMATVPFLQDIAQTTDWFTSADLADMIAVSESTPGPVGVNMATYVGFKTIHARYGTIAGVFGGITTTIGLIAPSIIIILIIAKFLDMFRGNRYVEAAMYGLRAASVALISSAGISIVLIAVLRVESLSDIGSAAIDSRLFLLAAVLLVMTRFIPKIKDLHPIAFIALSAIVGIVMHMSA